MRVRAIKAGYLGYYREEGDEFDISDDQFSDVWMQDASLIVEPAPPSEDIADVQTKKAKGRGKTPMTDSEVI